MRHPIEIHNQNQAELLASLPEEKREWMARMFRIGNATYCYYNRAKDLAVFNSGDHNNEPAGDLLGWLEQHLNLTVGTPEPDLPITENQLARELLEIYFDEYLEGLSDDGLRRAEKKAGLEKVKNGFPFRRYVLERHDIGLDAYLRMHLSEEDYAFHKECSKPVGDNEPTS